MRIHLIAIGGAAMHNLAIALQLQGNQVSGSDDEIYQPSRGRLEKQGLLPAKMGWDEARIDESLDMVIVGMHARPDNPELAKALELGIPVHSYPSFVYEHAAQKHRVVVAGSHGKTTTTSMIMHVLQKSNKEYDYLVGAQLEGFEHMVHLSDADLMVIEGDEYLSSPIDRRPKILHYRPQITAITGIAWDHMNVFPTFEGYVDQFRQYLQSLEAGSRVFYFAGDPVLRQLVEEFSDKLELKGYPGLAHKPTDGQSSVQVTEGTWTKVPIFGAHNFQNLHAALLICQELGILAADFAKAIQDFTGAARRLELLAKGRGGVAYLDFAHAPSKVAATVQAVREQYPDKPLHVFLELHTYSSLNKDFIPQYAGTLASADVATVYYDPHTFAIKKLPFLEEEQVAAAFEQPGLEVCTEPQDLRQHLEQLDWTGKTILFMSSGNFGRIDLRAMAEERLGE